MCMKNLTDSHATMDVHTFTVEMYYEYVLNGVRVTRIQTGILSDTVPVGKNGKYERDIREFIPVLNQKVRGLGENGLDTHEPETARYTDRFTGERLTGEKSLLDRIGVKITWIHPSAEHHGAECDVFAWNVRDEKGRIMAHGNIREGHNVHQTIFDLMRDVNAIMGRI